MKRFEEIYGVLEFGIGLLGGVAFLIVGSPPRLPTKQAQRAQLSGCSRQRVSTLIYINCDYLDFIIIMYFFRVN